MNILYISNTTYQGGATIALYNIVKSMVHKGHNAYVVSNNGPGPLNKYMREAGATILYAPVSDTVYERPRGLFKTVWRFYRKAYGWHKCRQLINKYLQEYSIDIVHTNVGPLNLALNACIKHSIPHVWHQREYFDKCDGVPFFPFNRYFYHLINKRGNFNICITEQIKNYLKLSDNAVVVYDGVYSEKLLCLPEHQEKDNIILFVGRFEENKGLKTLLSVWSRFVKVHSDYKLLIAGHYSETTSYYKDCRKIIESNAIESSVEILGNRNDVYDLMKRSKALVVTSLYEGFGFITVEGMLNNTVVIGRDTTGTHEQFENGIKWTGGEIGLRFSTEDQLLNCLFEAVTKDLTEMKKRAKVAIKNYTIENNADTIETVYCRLLSENKI